ncbi:hypothetical protein [Methanocella arvoryzae]|uniref:Uncharacterized protein n=1 Tax=Methanocella arvoryzae (strain DSM 22066 / NBRC 105507 / MRE50) TaxID=351160 RepID=Q0W5Q0_METAR|nr:hypothetical protein [Methanocella arvoryzae]CAJ36293.1 conserved hypothetical protein [Methanocella arvoryzae MRE50]
MRSAPGLFPQACKASCRLLSQIIGRERLAGYAEASTSPEMEEALAFTGMETEAVEVLSLAIMAAAASFALILAAGLTAFTAGMLDNITAGIVIACAGIIPVVTFVIAGEYPKRQAYYMRVHSLGDMPEVVSYIVMAMKLNPNMERSLRFTVKNSRRQLARDIRKLMWDLQIRAYDSMDDALDALAGQNTGFSDHFKRSLFIIKSSTGEREVAMRTISLNRALQVILDGTRSLMSTFSSTLHAPTLILYSIFVMVPLALVAMLPAAAVVGIRVNAVQLFLLYDLAFPLVTLAYAHSILLKRPAAFAPPEIPPDHPEAAGTPKWAWALTGIGLGAAIASLYFFLPVDALPFPGTTFILWGITAAISIYCYCAYRPYKLIRDRIVAMEGEFADSLFVLGRRISEGRSPEEAFAYTARIVTGTTIGKAYARAAYNIRCLRTTLSEAVLDPDYGAFSDVYSDRIRATINMLVETSGMSGEVAGTSVIVLADHLKELQAIEQEVRKMLFTMTSMLRTTCIAFAPFIGGVTLALSGAVTAVIAETAIDLQNMPEAAKAYFPMVPQVTAPLVSADEFMLIVGLYIVLLVIILLRFVSGIEHGDDEYEFMYSVGTTLPFSVAVFTLTTVVSGVMFSGMM